MSDDKHVTERWKSERLERDFHDLQIGHYTVRDDWITVFCEIGGIECFSKHSTWLEVKGANQEKYAALVSALPLLLEVLEHARTVLEMQDYRIEVTTSCIARIDAAIVRTSGKDSRAHGEADGEG